MCFSVQIYSNRELEDQLSKIRDALSDDKHDWELRVAAVRVAPRPRVDHRANAEVPMIRKCLFLLLS